MTLLNKKSIRYITFTLLMFAFFFLIFHAATFMNFDDIWNYNFVKKIHSGSIPYLETNIMVTPLYHFICSLFMCIFGDGYIAFSICGAFLQSIFFTLILFYLDSHVAKTALKNTIMLTFILTFSFFGTMQYNILFLSFALSTLILNASSKKTKNICFLSGILLGLGFLCKQTFGLVFIAFYGLYLLLSKTSLKEIAKYIGGLAIPTGVFLIYLIITNSLYAFMDQCFFAIFEFGTNNGFLYPSFILLTIFFDTAVGVYHFFKYKKESEKLHLFIGMWSIASVFLVFPIVNIHHMMLGLFIPLLLMSIDFGSLYESLSSEKSKKILKRLNFAWALAIFLILVVRAYTDFKNTKFINDLHGLDSFENITINDDDFYIAIKEVVDFIEQKRAEGYYPVILSSDAPLYYIHTGNPKFKYDLVLSGNMGYDGASKAVAELEKIDNVLILKNTYQTICYQEPIALERYVLWHYKETGNIRGLRIFEKK